MNELRSLLSSEQSEVVNTVILLKNEKDELKAKLKDVIKSILTKEIDSLKKDSPALIFTDDIDAKSQREVLSYLISKRDNYCGILAGNDKKGYSYLIGSNSLDSSLIQTKLREKFGAKGGGRQEMIQGFAKASKNEIEALLNTFPFN